MPAVAFIVSWEVRFLPFGPLGSGRLFGIVERRALRGVCWRDGLFGCLAQAHSRAACFFDLITRVEAELRSVAFAFGLCSLDFVPVRGGRLF